MNSGLGTNKLQGWEWVLIKKAENYPWIWAPLIFGDNLCPPPPTICILRSQRIYIDFRNDGFGPEKAEICRSVEIISSLKLGPGTNLLGTKVPGPEGTNRPCPLSALCIHCYLFLFFNNGRVPPWCQTLTVAYFNLSIWTFCDIIIYSFSFNTKVLQYNEYRQIYPFIGPNNNIINNGNWGNIWI